MKTVTEVLHKIVEDTLKEEAGFKKEDFFVLALGERSGFKTLKEYLKDIAGEDFLKAPSGTYRFFVLFRHLEKKDILDKLNSKADDTLFGNFTDKDIVEYKRESGTYYIVKVDFSQR